MNSCSGSGSAAVVSNCYQLAWILAVFRVASEVCDSGRWLKFKLDYSPQFSSAKLKMAIAVFKVIWVSPDDKTGESEVGASSNINALLTCLLLWILWDVTSFYWTRFHFGNSNAKLFSATRLSWIKSLLWFGSDNKVDHSSHIITKKKQFWVRQNKIMTQWWNYNFYGRGCCDSRDHGDWHRLPMPVSDPRHDTDTTEPNAPRLIYLAGWNTKTPIDGRLLSFLFTFDPDT